MSNNPQFSSNESNVLDNVDFRKEEAELFMKLIGSTGKGSPVAPNTATGTRNEVIPGTILKGHIVELTRSFVIVDVGLKSEGLVAIEEFSSPSELTIGSEIEVYLEQPENDRGQIVLSREKAEKQRQWEHIVNHCTEGSIVTGHVLRKVKGGLMVDIGMEAFLPGSQIDNKRIKNLDEYIDKTFDFKILKINIERKNVVVSRRELLEAERVQKKTELLESIQEGNRRKGVVKNVTDFGVFLDLDGIDGLLHITDMTWKRIKHPSEMVHVGQELEVVILHIDREKGRVALGLKQMESNPWEEIESRYPVGKRVHGRITNLVPYGAFMELEPGVEGLIHVSEMSWVKTVTDPSEVVNKGSEVDAVVLSIQKEEGKISLGIKQTEHNPWDEIQAKYPIGAQVEAEVKSLTNYGAFVELEPGVEGLIHVSDLSWVKKVAHPSEVLSKGEKVHAVVLSVDHDSKKITLGIKQLSDNPWKSIETVTPVGSLVKGVVTKITAFGAFVELDNGLEGLIHMTELSDQTFGKVEDVVAKGQEIVAKVLKIDAEHKKIALSLKEYLIDQTHTNHDDIVIGAEKVSADKRPAKKKHDA